MTRTLQIAIVLTCFAVFAIEPTVAADPAPAKSATAVPSKAPAMNIEQKSFGQIPQGQAGEGEEVTLFTLKNKNGVVLRLINYGAAIQSLEMPDRDGKPANIMLGFDDLAGYLKHKAHFGCTIGRFGNRIAKGKFTLDGKEHALATNNGPNHLHGGPGGFDRVIWKAEPMSTTAGPGVKFTYTSKDGEEGYPGTLETTVVYTLSDKDEVTIDYTAKTDKPTVVNLTNHAYWTLGGVGSGSVLGTEVMLNADKYLAVDNTMIPTGKLADVSGTMDFTKPKKINTDIAALKKGNDKGGYDHCYVLKKLAGKDVPQLAARAKDPKSGRVMEILTDEPAIQFYTGNFLDGDAINGGHKQHEAFCLETQHYPDSPNQPSFPTTTLKPGETYRQTTVHRFSVEK